MKNLLPKSSENFSENLSENTKKINRLNNKINELNLILSNYKKKIFQLEEELNISISADDLQEIKIENTIIKNELNELKQKNNKILEMNNKLNSLVEEKDTIIKKLNYLKDQQHHG